MKLKYLLFFLFIFCSLQIRVYSQSEVSMLILSGNENANILAEAYFTPLGKSLMSNLSSGWFLGGKILKPGSFEVLFISSASFVPHEDKSFDIKNVGLSPDVKISNGYNNISPTALGDNTVGPYLWITTKIPNTDTETDLAFFHMPNGLGIPLVPLPSAQLNVGIIKETELAIQFLPKVDFRSDGTNYTTYMWGVGLRHNLSRWIPANHSFPFGITAAIAYTRQQAKGYSKRIGSWNHVNGQEIVRTPQQKDPEFYNNQYIRINTDVCLFELLLSKDIASFTFFSGIQYNIGMTYIDTPGIYPQVAIRASDQEPYYEYFFNDANNPIGVSIHPDQLGFTAGFQYSIGKFSLNAEGTVSAYKNLSAGLGFHL